MEELIKKLQSVNGLSAEQSQSVLQTITGFIKEKYPMVSGAIDNLFQTGGGTTTADTDITSTQATHDSTPPDSGDILDKISDFVPGATGQKIEDFAKDKLGGFFGEDKK